MSAQSKFTFDVATGLSQGTRARQEDAILCDIPNSGTSGLIVLADGLGGHAAGAVASHLAVSTAMRFLATKRDAHGGFHGNLPSLLVEAAKAANRAILDHTKSQPETQGMGATLVILALLEDRLHWLSIGDSPLYLLRAGQFVQLNATHSLAVQLNLLVEAGEMPRTAADDHPDRHCLTSALGEPRINLIDCPEEPLFLADKDVVLLASDGILSLSRKAIQSACTDQPASPAVDLANRMIQDVAALALPDQDNLSVALIRIAKTEAIHLAGRAEASGFASATTALWATLANRISPINRERRAK